MWGQARSIERMATSSRRAAASSSLSLARSTHLMAYSLVGERLWVPLRTVENAPDPSCVCCRDKNKVIKCKSWCEKKGSH